MKFLLVPDSFKGSISAKEFCDIVTEPIKECYKNAEILAYPISDGGENSVEYLSGLLKGRLMPCKATDSNFILKNVTFGVTDDIAIISVASSAGLADAMIKNPLYTTTYGVGEQIKMAKTLGKMHIYLCLGGSSTNDAGAGMLSALGVKFYDQDGNSFIPTGATLGKVKTFDLEEFNKNIKGMRFTALCDVTNPLLGKNGSSYVYARQKGASDKDIEILEENMQKYAAITSTLGVDSNFSGSGSAGGMGYAIKAFLRGEIKSGIDFFLDSMDFLAKAKNANYIFTGEGRLDDTSIMGKAIGGIMERSKELKAKLVVFCGQNALTTIPNAIYKVIQISDDNIPLAQNLATALTRLKEKSLHFLLEERNKQ
ncbi:MAG: glycerate kinase [Clostridiales bacterium]|nr:glycerate kinase [Clostridiales bacterium]